MYPFRKKASFYGEDLLAPRPPLKLEDHLLTGVRLRNTFAAILHYCKPFFHPPEDAPCRGEMVPRIMDYYYYYNSDKNHSISIQTLAVLSCDYHGALIHKEINIHDFSTLKVEQNVTVLVCSTHFFRRTVVVCYFDLS